LHPAQHGAPAATLEEGIVMPQPRARQDDLTTITGIGARIEAKLKQAGIRTFAQLGQTPVEKLAAISGYSTEQIEQKDWVGQATALAPAPPRATSDNDLRPPGRHNFTVELQLDASGTVLSSNIHHVQSGDQDGWRGWDGDRLASFIEVRAGPETRPATDSTAGQDLVEPAAGPEKARVPQGPSPVGFAQIRADRLLFPGSGPTIATLRLDASQLEAHDISASALEIEVYAQRPPFSKSRLLGRARTPLRREPAVGLDVDLLDPASESQLEVFAVLTFLDGTDVGKPPVWVELGDAEITPRSRLSRKQD
jgi:hypothetical protein